VPLWQVWPVPQSVSVQQAALAMHVPLQLFVPVPQLQAPLTQKPPLLHICPLQALSAQSAMPSHVLSTPSLQISVAPPQGMFTFGMPISFGTKVTLCAALEEMTVAQPMPPFARPTSCTSLGNAVGDEPICATPIWYADVPALKVTCVCARTSPAGLCTSSTTQPGLRPSATLTVTSRPASVTVLFEHATNTNDATNTQRFRRNKGSGLLGRED
jgi:hypothetical protein